MKREKKKVSMEDIAKRLNISKNSVSLALGDKKGVSSQLRGLVIETARQMNYSGYSSEGKTKCVISIIPEYIQNDAFFYSDIFWSIEKEANSQDCISVMSGLGREAEERLTLPQTPAEMEILGFLVIGVVSTAYITNLSRMGLPVVAVDIQYPATRIPSVTSSNLPGGFAATHFLIGKGHTRIGFIGPIYTAQSIYERWCGFNQAMERQGLNTCADWNIVGNKNEFKLFDTVEALEPLLSTIETFPSAWFCAGDRIAVALMNWLTHKGIKVPDQISVMGFDDIAVSELVYPALTTMRVSRKLMGRLAFEALLDKKRHEKQNISVGVALVERNSVRNCNAGA